MGRDEWVLYQDGACDVVTFLGLLIKAECAFSTTDDREVFTVKYTVPHKLDRRGEPYLVEMEFVVHEGYLMHPSLMGMGTYKRQK